MEQLSVGKSAYFDSFTGLIPVKVLEIRRGVGYTTHGIARPPTLVEVDVDFVVTRASRGYERGEVLTANGLHVVPRKALRRRKNSVTILPYSVAAMT
jgi:hypothetical protein